MAIEQSGNRAEKIEAQQIVQIYATNYDGSFHWAHPAYLVEAGDSLVVTSTRPNTEIKREGGIYVSPYETRAHYWTDRWFNVIRLELPDRGLFGYYCNIATPLDFDGTTVRYTDLQLDVIVRTDGLGGLTHWLADEDEFEVARDRYGYTDELIDRCYAAVEELRRMIDSRTFPFDK